MTVQPTMDKSFKCPQCPRSFTRVENLNRHRRTHNEVLPYRCDLCQRGFSRSDLFKKHRLLHDRDQSTPSTRDVEEHGQESSRKRVKPNSMIESSLSSPGNSHFASGRHEPTAQHPIVSEPHPDDAAASATFVVQVPQPMAHDQRLGPRMTSNASNFGQSIDTLIPPQIIDYAAFSVPWDDLGSGTHEWFTTDFYEALRETDLPAHQEAFLTKDYDVSLGPSYDGWMPSYDVTYMAGKFDSPSITKHQVQKPSSSHVKQQPLRPQSPPNVPSHEDSLPFAYNPASSTIRQGGHISIEESDPLLMNHDPKFDISQPTWSCLREFLAPPTTDHKDDFTLPSLRIANAFIGLFFRCFAAQSPVIHQATVDMNSLPPPLLASMMAIGATYSNRRHTRSFAILVLDRARRNVQTAIENDNRITRDPMVIYAIALMSYFCLWCGNKRAYEIGETARGVIVTFVRRLLLSEQETSQTLSNHDLKTQWNTWITAESKRRLSWFVFMLDGTFPVLLNIPSMMSLTEVTRWQCPCDEDFWAAPSAEAWKSVLSAALIPPAPTFATASGTYISLCLGFKLKGSLSCPRVPTWRLNDWTIFLIIVALSKKCIQWSHKWQLVLTVLLETHEEKQVLAILGAEDSDSTQTLVEERLHIIDALDHWRNAFLHEPVPTKQNSTDAHFQEAAILLHSLSRMFVNLSLTTIQSMLGKDGPHGVEAANRLAAVEFSERYMDILSSCRSLPKIRPDALSTISEAMNTATLIMNSPSIQSASPYSILTAFLSHAVLWAFMKTSNPCLKQRFKRQIYAQPAPNKAAERFRSVLDSALSDGPPSTGPRSNLVLKHAAQQLTEMGTWGCALNMALLLHKRAELE